MARFGDRILDNGQSRVTVGTFTTVGLFVLAIAALYVGREIFVPLALAVLFSFLLAPLVSFFQRHHVPKIPAVVLVVALAFSVVFGFALIVAGQLTQVAQDLPGYKSNIQTKIRDIKVTGPNSLFARFTGLVEDLGEEVAKPADPPSSAQLDAGSRSVGQNGTDDSIEPIPVKIEPPDLTPLEIAEKVIGPLIGPFVTAGVVIVFVIFILLQRQDLRDRLIRLVSGGDLNRTTQTMEDAGSRVAKYLLMQLVVNVSYGIPIGLGLWIIGVPYPALWGMLAMVLRFVPYIGPVVAAILPMSLAFAVDSGWTMVLWTIGLFIVLELVSNNIFEPWLYGSKTGLSPLAIIVAAIFWTWLWGPVGLLLSTPLTVCLVVLGRHVPQFGFLDVLLGSEPVLTPAQSLHQRLLASDPDEATENAEKYLENHTLEQFYGDVTVPALASLERDRENGALDEDRRRAVVESMFTLMDNLSEVEDTPVVPDGVETQEREAAIPPRRMEIRPEWERQSVLCVGARSNLDDAAAAVLSQLLERRGIGARWVSWSETRIANLSDWDATGVQIVCLLYLNENSVSHARYLVRRIKRRMPNVQILGAMLSLPSETSPSTLLDAIKSDLIATSLRTVLDQISTLAGRTADAGSEREEQVFPLTALVPAE